MRVCSSDLRRGGRRRSWRRGLLSRVLVLCPLLVATAVTFAAAVDDEPAAAPALGDPRHRLDFGVQWFDVAEGASFTGALNYSWVPLDHHGFAVAMPLVRADFG